MYFHLFNNFIIMRNKMIGTAIKMGEFYGRILRIVNPFENIQSYFFKINVILTANICGT